MKVLSELLMNGPALLEESAASTWTYRAIDVPTAARNKIGISIVATEMFMSTAKDVPPAGVGVELMEGYVLEEEETTEPDIGDPDIIGYHRRIFMGDGVDILHTVDDIIAFEGKLGMIDPQAGYKTLRDNIYIACISTNAATAGSVAFRIYYYIVEFTTNELVELGFRESFE